MKTKITLILTFILFSNLWAGSISGEIAYSGNFSQTIYIAVFTNSSFDGEPFNMTTIDQPGTYTISDIEDGTYYIASVMTANTENMQYTDPYAFYGTLDGLTPIVISGNADITGINLVLVDGTIDNPNPFGGYSIEPDRVIQLPETTSYGRSPFLAYDGTSIYLYKHDYEGAPSAKIYVLNQTTGDIQSTYNITLESNANRISWMAKIVFHNGEAWAKGGYGNPNGLGYTEGIFKVDLATSTSSSQIQYKYPLVPTDGLTSDGVYLYTGVDSLGVNGVVKFNPDNINSISPLLFTRISSPVEDLCYANNILWVGDRNGRIHLFDSNQGNKLMDVRVPGYILEIMIGQDFYAYNENDNTLEIFSLSRVNVNEERESCITKMFSLSQNYPNPFNPSTIISWQSPISSWQTLKVYDILGNEVATLVDEYKTAGSYEVEFNASKLSSGVYFYRLQSGNFSETKKLILMK